MRLRADVSVSIFEIFLPFLLFKNDQIFFAIGTLFLSAALMLVFLELLRPLIGARAMRFFSLMGLAVWGGIAWVFWQIPPYWIWSLYLLIPHAAWEPSVAQKKKPAFFGFKKYLKRRTYELLGGLAALLFFALTLIGFRTVFSGPVIWLLILLLAAVFESLTAQARARKT